MIAKVAPYSLVANGLTNPFTNKKKWRITCGECKYVWDEKRPAVENTSAICPACHALNAWSLSKWFVAYECRLKALEGE